MQKVFDNRGRLRPVDHQKNLDEVTRRHQHHMRNCKRCLRIQAGVIKRRCTVETQIEGQMRVIVEAKRRAEQGGQ